jgi:sucrose phosphorylase
VADCGEKITALFNFSDNVQTVYDILSGGNCYQERYYGTELTLNPWQVLWIKEN